LNILLASYYPLPALGGIWTYVSQLKDRLERQGHSVDILAHSPDTKKYRIIGKQPELKSSLLHPYINKQLRALTEILPRNSNTWIYQTEVYRYSLELSALYYGLEKYDIIHAQDVMAARSLSRVKPKHIPIVTSAHGYLSGAIFYHLKTIHRNLTDEKIKAMIEYQYHQTLEFEGYHSSDLIHAPSNWTKKVITNDFSIPSSKVMTFQDGMDIEGFLQRSHGTAHISRPNNKKIIIYTGRLVYLKGVHYLIDALALLKQTRIDWECWILGEGNLKSELQAKSHQLGLEKNIRFLGSTNNVPYYLKQADLFVLPGLQDTQPQSVIEAQLMGIPVIVSNASALPEMIQDGVTGLVVPVRDTQQLAKQINYLLKNENVRKKYGKQAKVWAKRWSMDKMIKSIITMYQEAIFLKKLID
jgi:glycosyltransferase involved in cell wall biosynthesis